MRRFAPFFAAALLLACASVALARTTKPVSAVEGDKLSFSKKKITVRAGKVTLKMHNPSDNHLEHSIAIHGHGSGTDVSPGGTSTVTAKLKKGTYTFFCPVSEHEAEGMKGKLVVR
jgi:plastocyanin